MHLPVSYVHQDGPECAYSMELSGRLPIFFVKMSCLSGGLPIFLIKMSKWKSAQIFTNMSRLPGRLPNFFVKMSCLSGRLPIYFVKMSCLHAWLRDVRATQPWNGRIMKQSGSVSHVVCYWSSDETFENRTDYIVNSVHLAADYLNNELKFVMRKFSLK